MTSSTTISTTSTTRLSTASSSWPSSRSSLPPLSSELRDRLRRRDLDFSVNEECTSLDLSPDGRLMVAGFSDGTLRLFDLAGRYHRLPRRRRGRSDDADADSDDSEFEADLSDDSEAVENGGAVAAQIRAKGVHTSLRTRVAVAPDCAYAFGGVERGSTEAVAISLGGNDEDEDEEGDLLDAVRVYKESDAKLRGFGACTRWGDGYRLFCGIGIKNVHVWSYLPPTHVRPTPCWSCLFDVPSNGNTVAFARFLVTDADTLVLASKSDDQRLRVWDLSDESRRRRPPHRDVPGTEDALGVVGRYALGVGVGGGVDATALDDAATVRRRSETALPFPAGTGAARSSRRSAPRRVASVVGDDAHALVTTDDGATAHWRAGTLTALPDDLFSGPGATRRTVVAARIGREGAPVAAAASSRRGGARAVGVLSVRALPAPPDTDDDDDGFWGFRGPTRDDGPSFDDGACWTSSPLTAGRLSSPSHTSPFRRCGGAESDAPPRTTTTTTAACTVVTADDDGDADTVRTAISTVQETPREIRTDGDDPSRVVPAHVVPTRTRTPPPNLATKRDRYDDDTVGTRRKSADVESSRDNDVAPKKRSKTGPRRSEDDVANSSRNLRMASTDVVDLPETIAKTTTDDKKKRKKKKKKKKDRPFSSDKERATSETSGDAELATAPRPQTEIRADPATTTTRTESDSVTTKRQPSGHEDPAVIVVVGGSRVVKTDGKPSRSNTQEPKDSTTTRRDKEASEPSSSNVVHPARIVQAVPRKESRRSETASSTSKPTVASESRKREVETRPASSSSSSEVVVPRGARRPESTNDERRKRRPSSDESASRKRRKETVVPVAASSDPPVVVVVANAIPRRDRTPPPSTTAGDARTPRRTLPRADSDGALRSKTSNHEGESTSRETPSNVPKTPSSTGTTRPVDAPRTRPRREPTTTTTDRPIARESSERPSRRPSSDAKRRETRARVSSPAPAPVTAATAAKRRLLPPNIVSPDPARRRAAPPEETEARVAEVAPADSPATASQKTRAAVALCRFRQGTTTPSSASASAAAERRDRERAEERTTRLARRAAIAALRDDLDRRGPPPGVPLARRFRSATAPVRVPTTTTAATAEAERRILFAHHRAAHEMLRERFLDALRTRDPADAEDVVRAFEATAEETVGRQRLEAGVLYAKHRAEAGRRATTTPPPPTRLAVEFSFPDMFDRARERLRSCSSSTSTS